MTHKNKVFPRLRAKILLFLLSLRNQLDIYRIMLSDKKYGLSVNMMATRVLPSLVPQTVNPSLNLEQFMILLEVSLSKATTTTSTETTFD